MPYIEDGMRRVLTPFVDRLSGALRVCSVGALNYCITQLVLGWLSRKGPASPTRYVDYNAAIGVLECAKLELYRRMVAPYEDKKIAENGDVF